MSSSSTKGPVSEREIALTFNAMKQELQAVAEKLNEMETEKEEHTLVLNALNVLNADRKCFRLIGGILVERTVGEVIPALKANQDGITQITNQLNDGFKKKEEELLAFQKKHQIKAQ